MFWIIFIILLFSPSVHADEIIDLGTYGTICDLKQDIPFFDIKLKSNQWDISPTFIKDLSYKPSLLNNSALVEKDITKEGGSGQRIFIFGAKDDISKIVGKNINANYAVCVNYDSINDIALFREETGLRIPIQLANDEILSFLQVNSYPLIITIRESGEDESNNN